MEALRGEAMYGAKSGFPGRGVARDHRRRVEQMDKSSEERAKIVVIAEDTGEVQVFTDIMGQRAQGCEAAPLKGAVHTHHPGEFILLG
jgi:hypothetical protein